MRTHQRKPRKHGGGWPAVWYVLRKARGVGLLAMWRGLRSRNACKTCALGMGGQRGGMTNEIGRFPEVCKKSVQAMAADLAGAIAPRFFERFSLNELRAFTPRELEAAGRITQPLYAGPLDSHFKPIAWDEAIRTIAARMKKVSPDETFFYSSGRSSNEAGFLLQVLARCFGTNHVNNCSYYCHQASGVGLASVIGSGTATIELEDLDASDHIWIIGANPASNHPRFMRTLVDLKRRGGTVVVVNPLREPGLERFRVPSDVRSMLFGSTIADLYLQPNIGGDIALLAGVAKAVVERNHVDRTFVEQRVDGWPAFESWLRALDWSTIELQGGVPRANIERAATMYAASKATVFCWAMGITHHEHGVRNVQMISNLVAARGMIGGRGRGLLPLRGHSNIQGIGSMGVTPALKAAVLEALEHELGVALPRSPGLDTLSCLERALEGRMSAAVCVGGNLYGASPEAAFTASALGRLGVITYLSTTLNTGHIHGRARETFILPVLARDEEQESTTQESMFNYVRLSDGGPRRHEGPRSETEVLAALAEQLVGNVGGVDWAGLKHHHRIREAVGRVIPGYAAITGIDATKKEFHVAGRTLHEPRFATPTGRLQIIPIELPHMHTLAPNELRLMTMRSEGQFNTVVYEEEDVYRGQDRRDVILMNPADLDRMNIADDALVAVTSDVGSMRNIRARAFNVPPGNAAMYYPESNVLVSRRADKHSRTPSFKSFIVRIEIERASPAG